MKRSALSVILFGAGMIALRATTSLAADAGTNSWKLLFDGKTTAGWREYGKKSFPKAGWVIEDGCLRKLDGGSGGNLVTEAEYEDFEFEWEWKLPAKANNGVKYLVTEQRPSAPGHEYQMVDDSTVRDPRSKTATFYDVLPLQVASPIKPPGEWNTSRIVVLGPHVEHWLNGVKVLEYELGSPEVKAALEKSKFRNEPRFGDKIKGRIMLTDHHDEAWYRNLRIRELPAPKA